MEILKHLNDGTYNVTLSGRFTFNDHPGFRTILQTIGDKGIQKIVLHMAGVEFVDSAALGMLLLALDEANKHNKALIISGVTGQVKKMFDVTHFYNLFTMRET